MIQRRGARWRVVVQGQRDDLTGKRRQLSGSAATEREAVALERAFRLVPKSSVLFTQSQQLRLRHRDAVVASIRAG